MKLIAEHESWALAATEASILFSFTEVQINILKLKEPRLRKGVSRSLTKPVHALPQPSDQFGKIIVGGSKG